MCQIGLIWAQDVNGIIGDENGMCWHVPADFHHFKKTTLGCPIIMGRRTYESIGKPLPGRTNIIVTHDTSYKVCGAGVCHSLEEALELTACAPRVWITGGASLYHQSLPIADTVVVSEIDYDVLEHHRSNGIYDTHYVYAPEIDRTHWKIDPDRSDVNWREHSGDARWRVGTYIPTTHKTGLSDEYISFSHE